MSSSAINQPDLGALIKEAKESGGSELANYQTFVSDLARALGLNRPDMAKEENRQNDYVYERAVTFNHPNGKTSTGRIDCYKRGCFILEAKQSAKRQTARATEQLALAGLDVTQKQGQAKRGTKGWDKIMIAAKAQAEGYARALPVDHGYPPFLLIVDVGNVIEVFADFSGQGKNYAHFPDRKSFRLTMDDLLDPKVQQWFPMIWSNPEALNPAKKSAEVTQDIAERLAKIAKRLEKRYEAKDIAEFLMRCLFTMFAEDAGDGSADKKLIPNRGFEKLLEKMVDTPDHFAPALESLWKVMDTGGYAPHLNATLKKFNGGLFKKTKALKLDEDDIRELWLAAKKEWKDVEPAIFGTLLERALDAKTRSSLGAHYTPRPYVERLVIPTIIEPLRDDWEIVLDRVEDLKTQGDDEAAIQAVRDFHHKLCTTRVLDPACGTGNFLYVSLELMKLLEGEILQALEDLGDDEARLLLDGETVSPKQFYGLEINERAVPIADLVLWIGFLKWQLRTVAATDIPEPILNAYGTIRHQDALIAYDDRVHLQDEQGGLITIWDGESMKLHPITGEEIPDDSKRKELYRYIKPRRADWPEVEFIVGNPPFIGGKDMRSELGDGYAEACWKVRPDVPGGADFVMHFWDEAARRLTAKPMKGSVNALRRFGFITTNSITQTFSRRVVEKWINAKEPLSLVYAVPDHPWMKASDKAAVRIAMTVAEIGSSEGVLRQVINERNLSDDIPQIALTSTLGKITPKLRVGANLSGLLEIVANDSICARGVSLHGMGFVVPPHYAGLVGETDVVLPFVNGRDLTQRSRNVKAIDFFGIQANAARDRYPKSYQYIYDRVKPERDQNRRKTYRENWWIWGEPRKEWRELKAGLEHIIGTTRTAKHRTFQFLDGLTVIESGVVGIAISRADYLSLLSSRLHIHFALSNGAFLEDRPTYQHTQTFVPFPFPLDPPENLSALGERLDGFRKERLDAHDHLTMTGLYNVLERARELEHGADVEPLSESEKDVYDAGQIAILKELHDDIDRAAFAAYGWNDLADRLVGKPGATTPSPYKSEDQEAAEEELLMRLVELNQQRAADEKRGIVRWLRPDFQIPRLGHKVQGLEQTEADLGEAVLATEEVKWPSDGLDQIRALRDLLAKVEGPTPVSALSAVFKGRNTGKRRDRIEAVLETLVATGAARAGDDGYFLPR